MKILLPPDFSGQALRGGDEKSYVRGIKMSPLIAYRVPISFNLKEGNTDDTDGTDKNGSFILLCRIKRIVH